VADDTADDPLDWRPTLPHMRRRAADIRDPIIEPYWVGLHVLAHFDHSTKGVEGGHEDGPWLSLIDVDGDDVTDEEPAAVAELATAILAHDAIIDGFLTVQATRSGEGVAMVAEAKIPRMMIISSSGTDIDMRRLDDGKVESPYAFVAIDLLRVDGQSLLDVPLLERKRILDGLLRQGPLVRVSPYTRPPLRSWLQSWKSAGFGGAVVKAANSRYVPTTVTREWTVVTKLGAR
jgi:bifunctional non-homologous end joining protein LigD